MKLHTTLIACLAFSFAFFTGICHVSEATGFSVDLIHRDSIQSPSLDSSLTASERVTNALKRSFHRVNALKKAYSTQSASADIISDAGEYLMKFSLGTPHVETLAIADTGSDLTWIQCKPCVSCFKQKAPIFDPNTSSTYKLVSCNSDACDSLQRTSCSGKGGCGYTIEYGDRSFSKGDLAKETVTLGSTAKESVSFPNVTIGCGHLDQGTFGAGASGIVGLGGGKVSLITQMGSSIQGKFSYCLVPYLGGMTKTSKMRFGKEAIVSGAGVVSTPIVSKTPKTFYFLTLEGMTVGNKKLYSALPSSTSDSKASSRLDGNIIIDSGTTLTFLPRDLYSQVITAVKSQVKMRQIDDPQGLLSLCFLSRGNAVEELPEVTAHFKGADVKLNSRNIFVKTSQNSLCLAFTEAEELAIYGNLAQMDFLVGYDFEKNTVSFKPTDCSKA